MPCLRRAASLAYTDADEDAERLLSFSDAAVPAEGDEWVETHAGRKASHSAGAPGVIEDEIPDLDESHVDTTTAAMANLSMSKGQSTAVPDLADLDEIPDMEEELEGEDDEATAAPVKSLPTKSIGTRYALYYYRFIVIDDRLCSQRSGGWWKWPSPSQNLRCNDHVR